ncbi:MAG: hypothetical protein ABIR63_02930 [Sphingomicrobium sp.]
MDDVGLSCALSSVTHPKTQGRLANGRNCRFTTDTGQFAIGQPQPPSTLFDVLWGQGQSKGKSERLFEMQTSILSNSLSDYSVNDRDNQQEYYNEEGGAP